jgi:hypothetical protein
MTVNELDEIQYDMEVDGNVVRRQVSRKIWEHRGWATVMVLFEEKRGEDWVGKLAIFRMRKRGEGWQQHALVTLPGAVATELAIEITKHTLTGEDDEA